MSKFIKYIVIFICVLFLYGCNYNTYYDENYLNYVGETEDFVISIDSNGKYHISDFTRKSYGNDTFTVPKSVVIDGNEIYIDYVDNIFNGYKFLRKITIEFNKHEINLDNTDRLRIIEIDESNLLNPSNMFTEVKDIHIYITNSTKDYSIYLFYNYNTVLYQQSPDSTYTVSFMNNSDNFILLHTLFLLGIGLIGGIVLLIYHKVFGPFHNLSKVSSVVLFFYPIISFCLFYFFKNNLIYVLGTLLVIPLLIGVNAFIIADDSNLFKILTILLFILTISLSYFIILYITPTSLYDVLLASFIILLISAVILYFSSYKNSILMLSIILVPGICITSFKYLDLMYYNFYPTLIGYYFCTFIQIISYLGLIFLVIIFVFCIISLFKDYTIGSFKPVYIPVNFPGIDFGVNNEKLRKLPKNYIWDNLNVKIKNNVINIYGDIFITNAKNKNDLNVMGNDCEKKIKKLLNDIIHNYLKKNHAAPSYNVNLNVNYHASYEIKD